jgi:hypothetical protein
MKIKYKDIRKEGFKYIKLRSILGAAPTEVQSGMYLYKSAGSPGLKKAIFGEARTIS